MPDEAGREDGVRFLGTGVNWWLRAVMWVLETNFLVPWKSNPSILNLQAISPSPEAALKTIMVKRMLLREKR